MFPAGPQWAPRPPSHLGGLDDTSGLMHYFGQQQVLHGQQLMLQGQQLIAAADQVAYVASHGGHWATAGRMAAMPMSG